MNDRDRLIELLKGAETKVNEVLSVPLALDEWLSIYADHLLANGVIAPPVEVGQTVYVITDCSQIMMYYDNDYLTGTGAIECPFEDVCNFTDCNDDNTQVLETYVNYMGIEDGSKWYFRCEHINRANDFNEIGKTVFLTKEEAEKALAERSVNNG